MGVERLHDMTPTKPSDFIGKAGIIAKVMFHKAESFKSSKLPAIDRRYLLTGEAGTGKTSLAMALAASITGCTVDNIINRQATNVDWLNGQSCSVEQVRKWREQGAYLPLYGNRVVQIVDEIDSISPAAANEILSYLDSLPYHTLLIATTNKSVSELPDRLQSRFKVHRFTKVETDTISNFLLSHFPKLTNAHKTAQRAEGNVRAAFTDALSEMEVQEALATA